MEREHLRRLEEQLLSQDTIMEDEVKCQVALAMSQQQHSQAAPLEPNVAADLPQQKNSCTSTGLPADTGIPAIETMAQ